MPEKSKPRRRALTSRTTYNLRLVNINRFNEVWSIKMTGREMIAALLAIIIVVCVLVAALIFVSPLRTLLPGYLKEDQRQQQILNSMRVDSLATQAEINDAYASNLLSLINGTPSTISASTTIAEPPSTLSTDSLLPPSEREREFIRQFENAEQYNVTVTSAIAAEGISFYPPTPYGVVINGQRSANTVVLTTPPATSVSAIYSGTVVSVSTSPTDLSTIIIQHPNGFISKYGGIQSVFAREGDIVDSGTAIGITAKTRPTLTFEMWNKGSQLNPNSYIAF